MEYEYLIIWATLAVILAIFEITTGAFVGLYFALGAAIAFIVALAGGSLVWQIAAFAIVSIALLVLTRPYIMRRINMPGETPSNVRTVVGERAIVTIEVNNDHSTGQIRVGTEFWTARNAEDDATPIPEGAKVEVVDVAGVTARVRLLGE